MDFQMCFYELAKTTSLDQSPRPFTAHFYFNDIGQVCFLADFIALKPNTPYNYSLV
jgi:hypothetical protein